MLLSGEGTQGIQNLKNLFKDPNCYPIHEILDVVSKFDLTITEEMIQTLEEEVFEIESDL